MEMSSTSYTLRKDNRYLLDKKLGGSHNLSDRDGEDDNLTLSRMELRSSTLKPLTLPTEII
jgi:hypothetical protein